MKYGAHVSKGGFPTIAAALSDYKMRYPQSELAQIFVVGPLSTRTINLDPEAITEIRNLDLDIYIHSCYLNHLWSTKAQVRAISRKIMTTELEIAEKIRARGIVVHINDSANPEDITSGLLKIGLNNFSVPIYLENMYRTDYADSYSNTDNLQRLFTIINAEPSLRGRVRLCIDTSHLWATGFPVDNEKLLAGYLQEIRRYRPIIHLNDNRYQRGSRRDNHQVIGKGSIWKDSDSYQLVLDTGFPLILESPDYQQDLRLLSKR